MQPTRCNAFKGLYKPFEFAMVPRTYPPKPSLTAFEKGLRVIIQYLNVDKAVALKRVCREADSILKKELFEVYFPGIKPSLAVKQLVAREPAIQKLDQFTEAVSFAFYGTNVTLICIPKPCRVYCETKGSSRWIENHQFLCQHGQHLYFLAKTEAESKEQGQTGRNLVSFCTQTEKFQTYPILVSSACNLEDFANVTNAFFKNGKLILSSARKQLECRLYENDVVIENVGFGINDRRSYFSNLEFHLVSLTDRLNVCALGCFDMAVGQKWQKSLRKKDARDAAFYLCTDNSFVAVYYLTHTQNRGSVLANLDVFDHAGNKVVLISNMRIREIHKIWLSHNFLIYHDFKNRSLIFWNLKLMRYVATLQLPENVFKVLEVTITEKPQIKIVGATPHDSDANLSILTYTMA